MPKVEFSNFRQQRNCLRKTNSMLQQAFLARGPGSKLGTKCLIALESAAQQFVELAAASLLSPRGHCRI